MNGTGAKNSTTIMKEAIQMFDDFPEDYYKKEQLVTKVQDKLEFPKEGNGSRQFLPSQLKNDLIKFFTLPKSSSKNYIWDGYKPLDYLIWLVSYNALTRPSNPIDEATLRKFMGNIYPIVHEALLELGQKPSTEYTGEVVQIKPFEGVKLIEDGPLYTEHPKYKLAAEMAGWTTSTGGKRRNLRKRNKSRKNRKSRKNTRKH